MEITIKDADLRKAAGEGADAFLALVTEAIKTQAGGTLDADTLQRLNAAQTTLWAYSILHEEVMDGGFIQLIYNGYGPFFFLNPFAKAMREWGLPELAKIVNKGKKLFLAHKDELTKERNDEEFMALFEQYPAFDALDDAFVEDEEETTETVAHYVDEHLDDFVTVQP